MTSDAPAMNHTVSMARVTTVEAVRVRRFFIIAWSV
jgi:hypothetical protein